MFKENISVKLLINENAFDRFDKEIINISKGAIKISKDHLRNYYINDRPIFIWLFVKIIVYFNFNLFNLTR